MTPHPRPTTPPEDLLLPECDLCGAEIEHPEDHNFRVNKWGGDYIACNNCLDDMACGFMPNPPERTDK